MQTIETYDFSQKETSACLPIAVITARILYEREVSKEDFKNAITFGVRLWKKWRNMNEGQYMMHFYDLKTVENRLLFYGKHERIAEIYGKTMLVNIIEKEMGYKSLEETIKELDRHFLYSGVFTCNSIALALGKRDSIYYLFDSHAPSATIVKMNKSKNLYKLLLSKVYAENKSFEINVFI